MYYYNDNALVSPSADIIMLMKLGFDAATIASILTLQFDLAEVLE